MPSHVLVGLSGPAQAASDAQPPKDPKSAPKRSRKLGVGRLIKLVLLAVTIAAVGLAVWFFQPVPLVMGLVHTVTSKASTLNIPTTFNVTGASGTPEEQAQAEATSSVTTSTTPAPDASTSPVPDVHPPTLEAAARLAKLQAKSRAASGAAASTGASPTKATATPATLPKATATLPSEAEPATVAADPSGGATVAASTAASAPAAAEPPPLAAPPAPARPAAAPPPQARTAPAIATRPPLYSATDKDVAPPRPIVQQRLGGIVGAIDAGAEVTIEYVVDERGYVESAKAKSVPRSVGESVLMATGLHAIKSWRFQPAEKNGQPVRYRNSISFGAY